MIYIVRETNKQTKNEQRFQTVTITETMVQDNVRAQISTDAMTSKPNLQHQ